MNRTGLIAAATLAVIGPVAAQTRNARDTATTYGARLNAKGAPQGLNQARINNRVNSRIENRISLRLERFHAGSENNPTAALRAAPDDGSRRAAVIAPPPVNGNQPR